MNKSEKRKSLSNWSKQSKKGKENEPPDNDLMEVNDDEAERREKRKSKLLQLTTFDSQASQEDPSEKMNGQHLDGSKLSRKSSIANAKNVIPVQAKAAVAMNLPFALAKKALSNDQLTNLYAECIKLCSENKITQKNTWDLSLIDYINDVIEVQKERDQDMTNFQAASVTLDASVKIYSCRVDSVHSETYKVLGGLNRTAVGQDPIEEQGQLEIEQEGAEAGEKEKQEGEEEGEQKVKKRQKKISEGVNTLEANLENISIKQFDMGFDVDPLFKKTSAAFDEGGAKGLLLNHLSVYRNCELIFDSSDAVDDKQSKENTDENSCDISELQKRLLSITRNISNMEICPTFTHFQFSKPENRDEELEGGESMAPMTFDEQFSDEEVPANAAIEDDVDEHQQAIQQEQQLMDEITNQDDNEDGNDGNALGLIAPDEGIQKNKKQTHDLPEFLMTGDVDLSTIDPKLLSNWAGPNHWKFRANTKKENQSETSEKKRGKKKEAFFINWTETDDTNYEEYFAPPGRAATTLSAQILKKASQSNNLLPPDIHYDTKMFTTLFTKPKWSISLVKRRKAESLAKAQNGEGEENGDYIPQPMGEAQDFSDNEPDNNFVISAPPINDLGELELIAEPRKVEQIKIDFAKTSKFVDIKALKDSIWKELKTDTPQKRKSLEVPKNTIPFSDVLESLPSNLPNEVMKNVNVPFAFICLLHLANEKGLEISQEKDNLSELFIELSKK